MTDQPEPEKGDWVRVWGQVVNPNPHPEEYAVRLESHCEDFNVLVRRDRVVFKPGKVPDTAYPCTAMRAISIEPGRFMLCERHHDHSGKHRNDKVEWNENETTGFFERK